MNILVINAGSTTIKFKLFENEADQLTPSISGIIDKKHYACTFKLHKALDEDYEWEISEKEYNLAAELILKELKGIQINKVGFRIVHGGEKYIKSTLLTPEVIKDLQELNELAPLHNPPALEKVKDFRLLLPNTPFYGIFDTAFHSSMPPKAYIYALPYEYYEKDKVRRYGFHGISHKYIATEIHKLEPSTEKIISCHLGGGASITAIKHGTSIDTSMGFTPMEGLVMATRPGDLDDGALQYLAKKHNLTLDQWNEIANQKSGLLGVSGVTSDMRKLLHLEADGNERAHLAIEMYVYRVQKYIGAYASALSGVDVLVFTAGVGAGSDVIRKRICEPLHYLKIFIDDSLNKGRVNVAENILISTRHSLPVWVVPTDEELQIARELALMR
ncbi:MAG TPA: acetate/propionate family kinase [Candidatus Dojkabacteria bacterium]|nr:acetate/propionate family kinase [Candidatus Dojkabacteria bacterium]